MNAIVPTGRILPDLTQAPPVAHRPKTLPRKSKGIDDAEMRRLFGEGLDDEALAAHFGYGIQSIREHRWAMNLHRRRGRAPGTVRARPAARPVRALSRKEPKSLDGHVARMPPVDHPALIEARTIYPTTVVPVHGLLNVLVSGENSWKIGSVVAKGRWRGFPIFTLTLEERATCPKSCVHWRSCYGSAMHLAKRISHGEAFEERLGFEVGLLAYRHPGGFAVRLHVLGDFYSTGYVDLWRGFVERFPALHVFGFSARIDADDPIAARLRSLVSDHWPRFAVRFSNDSGAGPATVSIEHPVQKPADAIMCPQQLGKTASCATCALCWSTERRIAFVRH